MIGVDEAGRGPVIGSMFVACVDAPDHAIPDTIKDSKQLTRTKIFDLASEILDHPETRVIAREIPATVIDTSRHSVTKLTVLAMAEVVSECVKRRNTSSDVVMLDAGHPDADTYRDMVVSRVQDTDYLTVRAEHRADETYPQVSAAGVIAKSLRETHVHELHDEHEDFGSGYPNDPNTVSFLETIVENGDAYPRIVRESWSTAENIRSSNEQTTL